MSICGTFKSKFKYGNMAIMVDVACEDSEDFEIDSVTETTVTLIGHNRLFIKDIKKGKYTEYFYVERTGVYERLFKGGKSSMIKCVPFLDEKQHKFKPEQEPPKKQKEIKLTKKQEEYINHPERWKAKCSECGGKMQYNKSNFTYYCDCGNTLEV